MTMSDQHLTQATVPNIRIEIDWSLLLEQRTAVLRHTETPAYLLLPEIHQLMDGVHQDNLLLMINTLWHTGARSSECLALTPNHFVLEAKQPYVSVETLKSRGRPKRAGRVKPRLVPLCDPHFILQLERYVASHHIRKNELLFPITRFAANKRFDRLVAKMTQPPSIKITPHVFRHSFAVNAIFHGTPLPVLQGWLGHADINSTLVYTQVLSLETYHLMQRIQY